MDVYLVDNTVCLAKTYPLLNNWVNNWCGSTDSGTRTKLRCSCIHYLLFSSTAEEFARLCNYQDIIDLMHSAPSVAMWDAGVVII